MTEKKGFTVLHLCSAHIIKAVSQGIGRKTSDKGLKDFATFVFASELVWFQPGTDVGVLQQSLNPKLPQEHWRMAKNC